MTFSLAVVCEAPADARTGCELADRAICEAADWITPEVIESYRAWRGFAESESHLRWRDVPKIAARLGIRVHGHFSGEPGAPDAAAARLAIYVLNASTRRPDAIILLRDDDGQTSRRNGLNQARESVLPGLAIPIVIGLAHVMRECWVTAGFVPCNDDERIRLEQLQAGNQLGFDPTQYPERLRAKKPSAKLSSKRILKLLVAGDRVRESLCWRETPLTLLRERGGQTGLSAYLDELSAHLVPLFTGASPPATPRSA